MAKTREQILAEHPIEKVCKDYGIVLTGSGSERKAICPFHEDGSPSFRVNVQKQLWKCMAGCGQGSVIDLIAMKTGKTPSSVIKELGSDSYKLKPKHPPVSRPAVSSTASNVTLKQGKAVPSSEKAKGRVTAVYDYRNKKGDVVYQACRIETPDPTKEKGYTKSFRQRQPDGNGGWIWNMEGVTRVLYNLPKLLKTQRPIFVCYDPETEVLTPTGWVKITEEIISVAQYDAEDGAISFTVPTARTDLKYEGSMVSIEGKGISLLVTPEHRMLIRKKKKTGWNRPQVVMAAQCRSHWGIPRAGTSLFGGGVSKAKARLIAAWQADGMITNHHRTGGQYPAWNLKKERKKVRLREILREAGITWTEKSYKLCPEWTSFIIPKNVLSQLEKWVDDDAFKWSLLKWSLSARQAFCEELAFWDGDSVGNRGIRFFTSSKQSADVVVAIACMSGYSAQVRSRLRVRKYKTKPEYVVSLVRGAMWRVRDKEHTLVTYKGSVHCLTVPTGFLVVRRHGKVCISGNCEGEKDCNTVTKLGWVATTNVGGAGKWMDSYVDVLKDREVIVCGDNDEPGQKHVEQIMASLEGKAKSVRLVKIPEPAKDVTEFLEKVNETADQTKWDLEKSFNALNELVESAAVLDKGLTLPIQSMAELEIEFIESLKYSKERSLDFKHWLPKLGNAVRPLVPGELITIIAATKVGKSALAANLMMSLSPMPVLNFQQELPESLSFERFAAMATSTPARQVYERYISRHGSDIDWRGSGKINHIYSCHKTRLTCDQIEELIMKSELKIGQRPAVFVVDYIQLCGGDGKRYDNVSDAAEGMKVVAKRTKAVGVMLSQRGRAGQSAGKADQFLPVKLTDGKESGGIENSSGLVLGAWRDEKDASLITLKVLANTKGYSGMEIPCDFDGERLLITQRDDRKITEEDAERAKRDLTDKES